MELKTRARLRIFNYNVKSVLLYGQKHGEQLNQFQFTNIVSNTLETLNLLTSLHRIEGLKWYNN